MYLSLLLHGIASLPHPDAVLRAELEGETNEKLHARLAAIDSESAARLHPHDRQRVIRALESFLQSGITASQRRQQHGFEKLLHPALIVVLLWDRQKLYARINARVEHMIASGLIEETRALMARFGSDAVALSALGYKEARDFINGALTREELVPAISQATRRYAKRQMTFFRNEPQKRGWQIRPGNSEAGVELGQGTSSGSRGFSALQWDMQRLYREIESYLSSVPDKVQLWYVDASCLIEEGAKS
jgi:tRNA dimethylallyltransferase